MTTSTFASHKELSDFEGRLIRPYDSDYEEARSLYNGMIDKRLALIARCANADDVARAIALARAHDALVAVRGGHTTAPAWGRWTTEWS